MAWVHFEDDSLEKDHPNLDAPAAGCTQLTAHWPPLCLDATCHCHCPATLNGRLFVTLTRRQRASMTASRVDGSRQRTSSERPSGQLRYPLLATQRDHQSSYRHTIQRSTIAVAPLGRCMRQSVAECTAGGVDPPHPISGTSRLRFTRLHALVLMHHCSFPAQTHSPSHQHHP